MFKHISPGGCAQEHQGFLRFPSLASLARNASNRQCGKLQLPALEAKVMDPSLRAPKTSVFGHGPVAGDSWPISRSCNGTMLEGSPPPFSTTGASEHQTYSWVTHSHLYKLSDLRSPLSPVSLSVMSAPSRKSFHFLHRRQPECPIGASWEF